MRGGTRGVTTGQANARRGQHVYVHRRREDDNESTWCGSREGAASLQKQEVTCPRCKALDMGYVSH